MVQFYKSCMALLCLALSLSFAPADGMAQVQTPRIITINQNCGGYYEYLPEGYQPDNASYPLIIYLHGQGHLGNGSTELPKVLEAGLPKYISEGQFPNSFVVNSRTFRFIVISPQFKAWPSAGDVEAVVDYALASYPVDTRRVYVTGMSMGGGATWDYAGNNIAFAAMLAAIVPVCGASSPNGTAAHNMADSDLPVWATHNQGDPDVPVSYTDGYVNLINTNSPPPMPLARKTIFPVAGHDAWTTTYDPAWEENGMNIYEWMLQFERAVALPVALSDYRVAPSGREAKINWTTSAELNNQYFTLEHSPDGVYFEPLAQVKGLNQSTGAKYSYVDHHPYAGRNYYRLWQTDLDGKTVLLGVREILFKVDERQLLLYPNPAGDHIIVGMNRPAAGPLTISIINAQGRLVRRDQYTTQAGYWQQRVPVAQLTRGIYTLHFKGGNTEGTRKLIKH